MTHPRPPNGRGGNQTQVEPNAEVLAPPTTVLAGQGLSALVLNEGSCPFQARLHLLISHEGQSRGAVDLMKWEGSWFLEC